MQQSKNNDSIQKKFKNFDDFYEKYKKKSKYIPHNMMKFALEQSIKTKSYSNVNKIDTKINKIIQINENQSLFNPYLEKITKNPDIITKPNKKKFLPQINFNAILNENNIKQKKFTFKNQSVDIKEPTQNKRLLFNKTPGVQNIIKIINKDDSNIKNYEFSDSKIIEKEKDKNLTISERMNFFMKVFKDSFHLEEKKIQKEEKIILSDEREQIKENFYKKIRPISLQKKRIKNQEKNNSDKEIEIENTNNIIKNETFYNYKKSIKTIDKFTKPIIKNIINKQNLLENDEEFKNDIICPWEIVEFQSFSEDDDFITNI